jgi:hypothetical protein
MTDTYDREKLRSYRALDEVFVPAKQAAERNGVSLSEVIRQALVDYAEANPIPKKRTTKRSKA